MDSKEMQSLVAEKIKARQGQVDEIKAKVFALIDDILGDSKEIIAELDTLKEFGNVVIDIADDSVSTGLLDAIDGVVAKLIFNKYVDTPAMEAKYKALRDKILAGIDNAQGQVSEK